MRRDPYVILKLHTMKIWLLEDGKRTGPFETYEVRDRLSKDELNAETPAWYENAPGWVTLADVPSLSGLFVNQSSHVADEEPPAAQDESEIVASQGWQYQEMPPLHPVQRFFARFFDLTLYTHAVWLFRLHNGENPFIPVENSLLFVAYYIPYIIIDALLMHYLGTTPGKKLLGIEVSAPTSANGRLGLGEAVVRSMRVWIMGFGMFLITPIALVISWLMARKIGKFIWDLPRNYNVTARPLNTTKLLLYIFILMLSSFLLSNAIPATMKPATLEQWAEMMRPKKD